MHSLRGLRESPVVKRHQLKEKRNKYLSTYNTIVPKITKNLGKKTRLKESQNTAQQSKPSFTPLTKAWRSSKKLSCIQSNGFRANKRQKFENETLSGQEI